MHALWGIALCCAFIEESKAAGDTSQNDRPSFTQTELRSCVRRAYLACHEGWSADEVLLSDELNAVFLAECRRILPEATPQACNWALLNLRKAGKLGPVVTRRRVDRHDAYGHAAEIAARLLYDKHQQTIDRVFCDPDRRREFDEVAGEVVTGVSPYLLRKAALGLRKARRLRPELAVRVANWEKEILVLSARQIAALRQRVPSRPGVYIFRDQTGYLYIGETANLRKRLAKHVDKSDRESLLAYLVRRGIGPDIVVEMHVFSNDSPARNSAMRRAYESDLIASRKPRFNVRP